MDRTDWYFDSTNPYGCTIHELRPGDHPTPPIAGNLTKDVAQMIVTRHNAYPDLVDACQEMLSAIGDLPPLTNLQYSKGVALGRAFKRLRDALVKAGE